MNNAPKSVPRRFAKRAARLNALCKRLGLKPLDDERVQASFEARERRRAEVRTTNDPYRDCASVTAVAKDLGMRRSVLFEWLEGAGWLYRGENGWRATPESIDSGWIVQRGPESISWPQITPDGRAEIARHFDVNP